MLAVWMALAAVAEALLIVPFYLVWLIVGLRVLLRFCPCKKFKQSNSRQVALLLKYKTKKGLVDGFESTLNEMNNKESIMRLLKSQDQESDNSDEPEEIYVVLNNSQVITRVSDES